MLHVFFLLLFLSVLIDASKRGDLKKLMEVHQSGGDLMATDQYGMTALHHAARFGHKEITKYLIDQAPKSLLDVLDNDK